MPTIGASGFRFARRASALREAGVEAQGAEVLVLNAGPTGSDTQAEPPAERGETEPTGQSKLEAPLASELQSASAEFAQLMRELSEGLAGFKLEKTSDPHGAADVWTDIVKSRSEAFLDNTPDAARPALRKRVDSLKLFHNFKVRDFERNQTRQNAFASIREARNSYVELVEADPHKLLFAKGEMDRLVDSSDLSAGVIQSQKATSDLALARSYVRAGLNGDTPETLLDELKSGRLDALLTDEQRKELIGEVAEALGRREREMLIAGQADVEVESPQEVKGLSPHDGDASILDTRVESKVESTDKLFFGEAGDAVLLGGEEDNVLEDEAPVEDFGTEQERMLATNPVGLVELLSPRLGELRAAANKATDPEERASLRQQANLAFEFAQEELLGSTQGTRVLSDEEIETALGSLEGLTVTQQFDELRRFLRQQGEKRFSLRALNELLNAELPPLLGVAVFLSLTSREDAAGYLRRALETFGVQRWHHLNWHELSQDEHFTIVGTLRDETAVIRRFLADNGLWRDSVWRLEAAHFIAWTVLQDVSWVPGEDAPSGSDKRGRARAEAAARWAAEQLFPFAVFDGVGSVSIPFLDKVPFLDGLNAVLPASFAGGQTPLFVYWHLWQTQNDLDKDNLSLIVANLVEDVGVDLISEQLAEQYADHVRNFGTWVNVPGGVQLVDQSGRPVAYKDGSLIIVRWNELPEMSLAFRLQLLGSEPRGQSDSSFIFGSDLASAREPGGPQSLRDLSASWPMAMSARTLNILRESLPLLIMRELNDEFVRGVRSQKQRVLVKKPDGSFTSAVKEPRSIQPEEIDRHCPVSVTVDGPVSEGYLRHLCEQRLADNARAAYSVRAHNDFIEAYSIFPVAVDFFLFGASLRSLRAAKRVPANVKSDRSSQTSLGRAVDWTLRSTKNFLEDAVFTEALKHGLTSPFHPIVTVPWFSWAIADAATGAFTSSSNVSDVPSTAESNEEEK